ncbi:hypothetical protein [Clostridium sp. BJN0013]
MKMVKPSFCKTDYFRCHIDRNVLDIIDVRGEYFGCFFYHINNLHFFVLW